MANRKMTEYEPRQIREWLEQIKTGEIALPLFQRSYVWSESQVAKLLEALLTDRPVGAFLSIAWNSKDERDGKFQARSFFGTGEDKQVFDNCNELLLDGQQRLTSLWRALEAREKNQKYFVRIDDWENDELAMTASEIPVIRKPDKAKVVREPSVAKDQKLLPVGVLGIDDVTQTEDALYAWCLEAESGDSSKARKLARKIEKNFAQKLHNRNLYFIGLPEDVAREEAIEIYIRTNQSSSIIKSFDIAVAEYDHKKGKPLRNEIIDWANGTPATGRLFVKDGQKQIAEIGELILKIACLQAGKTPTDRNYWSEAVITHLQHGNNLYTIKVGLEWTFALLEEFHLFYREHLPSVVPLRVLPALYPALNRIKNPDHIGLAREILCTYLWRAFLGDRYARAANSRLKEDYDGLINVMKHLSSKGSTGIRTIIKNVPIFQPVKFPSQQELANLTEPIKPPTTKNAISRSILVISTLGGADDFSSGEKINRNTIDERERHHIFPKQFLRKNNVATPQINHGLNFALIASKTNKRLSNKPPLDYLKDRYVQNPALSEEVLKKRIKSHLIPYDAIKDVGEKNVVTLYKRFIFARAKLFERQISRLTQIPPLQ